MSKRVCIHVSDESYQAALYLARMAHKDTTWVYQQWVTYAKDESINSNEGLRQNITTWRQEALKAYQRSLEIAGTDESDDPPF